MNGADSSRVKGKPMQKIQKVAIPGAGAMGAYFASRFFGTEGFTAVLMAKDDRLDRLRTSGLDIPPRGSGKNN